MKQILILLCILMGIRVGFSQDVMRMEDGLTTTFKLTKMNVIQTKDIKQFDLDGKDRTYYAKVKFGKRSFDIEIYQTANHKLLWASYPIFSDSEYFRKDMQASNSFMEVYSLNRDVSGGEESCKVTFYKDEHLNVMVSYSRKKTGEKILENFIVGSCDL